MEISHQTNNLLADLGLADISPDQRREVLAKLQEMVDIEILYAVTSRLTDDQIAQLETITNGSYESDDAKGQAIVAKMKELLPDYEEIVGRALDELYQRIRQDAAAASAFLAAHPPKIADDRPYPPNDSSNGH